MKSGSLQSSIIKVLENIQQNKSDANALKRSLQYYSGKISFYFKQQLRYYFYILTHPVEFSRSKNSIYVIYNMGKVGSTTLFSTLWEKLPHSLLHHVHFMSKNGLKKREDFYANPDITKDDKALVQFIEKNSHKKLKIITLVREPVSRDISDLFQSLPIYFPDKSSSEITVNDLTNQIKINNFEHTLSWFDDEFLEYLNFDIYAQSFDPAKGYEIYKQDKLEILVIRLEDLSKCYHTALKEFTGIDFPKLVNTNLTDEKDSAVLNKNLKKEFKMGRHKLEEVYASKYVRHFYSQEEINSFFNKYSN